MICTYIHSYIITHLLNNFICWGRVWGGRSPAIKGRVGDKGSFRSGALVRSKDFPAPGWLGVKPEEGRSIFA